MHRQQHPFGLLLVCSALAFVGCDEQNRPESSVPVDATLMSDQFHPTPQRPVRVKDR